MRDEKKVRFPFDYASHSDCVENGNVCVNCNDQSRQKIDEFLEYIFSNNFGVTNVFIGINTQRISPEDIKGKALFIGDCAISTTGELRKLLGDRAICIDGCPPIASVHKKLNMLRETEEGKK